MTFYKLREAAASLRVRLAQNVARSGIVDEVAGDQQFMADARMEYVTRDCLSWLGFLGFCLGTPKPARLLTPSSRLTSRSPALALSARLRPPTVRVMTDHKWLRQTTPYPMCGLTPITGPRPIKPGLQLMDGSVRSTARSQGKATVRSALCSQPGQVEDTHKSRRVFAQPKARMGLFIRTIGPKRA